MPALTYVSYSSKGEHMYEIHGKGAKKIMYSADVGEKLGLDSIQKSAGAKFKKRKLISFREK